MIFALAGNQNSGKTTLFNALTGSNQHVGNFPGVTVDQKSGTVKGTSHQVVDLPGIYSLRPYSAEEIVTRDFIVNSKPDAILNIVDATNIERNLYLTLQLITLDIPMVIALNMMDEVAGNGWSIDVAMLSERLGVPVVPISAAKGQGISELVTQVVKVGTTRQMPKVKDFCPDGAVHRCIHSVCHVVEDHARDAGMARRFVATKLIEGDENLAKRIRISENEVELIEHSVVEMENETGLERNEAIADMRYSFIESVCGDTVRKQSESREHLRSIKIDKVLTGRFTAIPMFVLVIGLVFFLTFNVLGPLLQGAMNKGINALSSIVGKGLADFGTNPVVISLVVDGIFGGVGSVLSFLPVIVILFLFLSVLEDSGYMARIAFVMDKMLRKIGLSGKSFVPMLVGFGCSVPAIMSVRTIPSERDRKFTILLIPFMSCGAKIAIYGFFANAFFPGRAALLMACLYLGGILMAILVSLVLKRMKAFRGEPVPFMMELPNYRLPSLGNVLVLLWEKAKDFIQRAFSIILIATVAVWFLETFDVRLNVVQDSSQSILAMVGRVIAPLFKPLGFGNWQTATSLLTGLIAKEAVVSTMTMLLGGESAVAGFFGVRSVLSLLVFVLLYTPCFAAIASMKKELGSGKGTAVSVVMQCAVAWFASFAVYQMAGLFI